MRTKIAQEATRISRKVFASLPWGFRVAHLLTKLAFDTQEAFGKFVYAEFIKAGVTGMPDINGQPALSFQDKLKGPRAADRLPRGYGKDFGNKVWRTALKKSGNPEIVEEAISRVMVKFVQKDNLIREGSTLPQAEGYVMTAVLNMAHDVYRSMQHREEQFHVDNNGEAVDIMDPNAFKNIEKMLPKAEMAQILRQIKQINERAPDWARAQLEGMTNTELAAEWGTSIGYISKWERTFVPDIQKVFNRYLSEAA